MACGAWNVDTDNFCIGIRIYVHLYNVVGSNNVYVDFI